MSWNNYKIIYKLKLLGNCGGAAQFEQWQQWNSTSKIYGGECLHVTKYKAVISVTYSPECCKMDIYYYYIKLKQ